MVFLKSFRPFFACLVVVLSASLASADLVSGPQPGERVGAFTVTKVAGNANDGVAEGKSLCYRCKMGNRPVVMIFARTADKSLAELIDELASHRFACVVVVGQHDDRSAVVPEPIEPPTFRHGGPGEPEHGRERTGGECPLQFLECHDIGRTFADDNRRGIARQSVDVVRDFEPTR